MLDALVEAFEAHERLLWLVGLGSIALLVGTAVLIPWLIVRLPRDFFATGPARRGRGAGPGGVGRVIVAIFRNLLGAVLLAAGFIMLFLPGQGLLTILIAIALIDFPGKDALLGRVIRSRRVIDAANGIRRWAGKPEFVMEPPGDRPPYSADEG